MSPIENLEGSDLSKAMESTLPPGLQPHKASLFWRRYDTPSGELSVDTLIGEVIGGPKRSRTGAWSKFIVGKLCRNTSGRDRAVPANGTSTPLLCHNRQITFLCLSWPPFGWQLFKSKYVVLQDGLPTQNILPDAKYLVVYLYRRDSNHPRASLLDHFKCKNHIFLRFKMFAKLINLLFS